MGGALKVMVAYHGRRLGGLLIEEGLIPPNSRLLEIVIPADGAVILRYEVFVSADDLPKISRALLKLGECEAGRDRPIAD